MQSMLFTRLITVQGDAQQEEDDGTVTDDKESSAQEETAQEEAQMTIDALPELVQMMTDIQAALAEPESSAGPEDTTMETECVQGSHSSSCYALVLERLQA